MSEFFWPSGKVFQHGCQNCILRVHRNSSMKNIFFSDKNVHFFISLGHWAKLFHPYGSFFGVLAIFFRQGCQNCVVLVLENSCRAIFVSKIFFIVFGLWEIKLRHLSKLFSRGFQNCSFQTRGEKRNRYIQFFVNFGY